MRFTKEFKLECVNAYQHGRYPPNPGGCDYKTFKSTVRKWSRMYNVLGEVAFDKKPKRNWNNKLEMVLRVINGESIKSVAFSHGIENTLLSKWCRIYKEFGEEGLKLDLQGVHKMAKKSKISNKPKTKEELEKENEYLRAENEYLKKLNALVQKRKDRQPKKK